MTEYTNTPILPEKAKELMSLDTEYKEIITYGKIEEWFTAWDGKVYVSFSGGVAAEPRVRQYGAGISGDSAVRERIYGLAAEEVSSRDD